MTSGATAGTRQRTWIVLGAMLLLIALGAAYALPLLRHNAAEARCVAAVPAPDGSPGGNGEATLEWRLLPLPHWQCSYTTEAGEPGSVDMGWWG